MHLRNDKKQDSDKKSNDRCSVAIINSVLQMLLITNNHLLIGADLFCTQCFHANALFYLNCLYIFRALSHKIWNFFFISLNTYFLTEVNIGFSYWKIVTLVFDDSTDKSNDSIFLVCIGNIWLAQQQFDWTFCFG